jgi:hypothetical protein
LHSNAHSITGGVGDGVGAAVDAGDGIGVDGVGAGVGCGVVVLGVGAGVGEQSSVLIGHTPPIFAKQEPACMPLVAMSHGVSPVHRPVHQVATDAGASVVGASVVCASMVLVMAVEVVVVVVVVVVGIVVVIVDAGGGGDVGPGTGLPCALQSVVPSAHSPPWYGEHVSLLGPSWSCSVVAREKFMVRMAKIDG